MKSLIDPGVMEEIRRSDTNPSFGKDPYGRSLDEMLQMGYVPLDKPHGPTSHQVVSWVKDILGIEKAGHLGTLDPNTTGVLPVALGSAVKALSATLSEGKEYIALMQFHHDPDVAVFRSLSREFIGEIYQMVPVRSAVKRGLRTRRIDYLKILEIEGRSALLLIGCESGTYIRTLIHDLGEVSGQGAHMSELRRSRSGTIREEICVTLQELRDAWNVYNNDGDKALIRNCIRPVEEMLDHLPKITIKDSAVDAICHGAPLTHPGISSIQRGIGSGETVLISSLKGEAVAIARSTCESQDAFKARSGVAATVERVLMDPGTYPRSWKTHRK